MGTWNVMAVLKIGRMNEIADEMVKKQLQIITTRIKMERSWANQQNQAHTVMAAMQKKTVQLGTGFMIGNEIKKNILSFEPYNDGLCKL
jgi:hypothetical protein